MVRIFFLPYLGNRSKSDPCSYELFCLESHILLFPKVLQIPPESPCISLAAYSIRRGFCVRPETFGPTLIRTMCKGWLKITQSIITKKTSLNCRSTAPNLSVPETSGATSLSPILTNARHPHPRKLNVICVDTGIIKRWSPWNFVN